jgi:hypothetical protein
LLKLRRRERRKERMKYKALSLILALLIIAPMLAVTRPVTAVITPPYAWLQIVNPGPDGYPASWTAGPDVADQGLYENKTANFNFTTTDTSYGDTFFINVTLFNATCCKGWGIGVIFDNSTMDFVSAWRPTDHAFAPQEGASVPVPQVVDDVDATHKIFKWGFGYVMPTPAWTFNGTGTICQIQFRITASVTIVHPLVTSNWRFDPDWTTLYYYPTGKDLPANYDDPSTTGVYPAYFKYEWVAPTELPDFYVKPAPPSYQTALKKGDDVPFEVWVKHVNPGWSIVGFQFSLWFNASLLYKPEYYEIGPWMGVFATAAGHGEAVLSAAYDDYLEPVPDPELPPGYNKWAAVIFLVPGTVGYVPPFPGAAIPNGGEEGMLFRFHMTAVEDTIFPVEDWTSLTLHDMLVYNAFGMKIDTSPPENGTYRAPQRVLGLAIDLYTCRDGVLQNNGMWVTPPQPYNGKGPGNNVSDMFEPQAEVDLQALVTYNEWPVQSKLVAFEIHAPAGSTILPIYRENFTEADGVAWVKFRIPWPCVNPWTDVFGEWTAIATVEVAKQIVTDTMHFKVWWPFEIMNVTGQDVTIDKLHPTAMKFTVVYRTLRMQQNLPLILTVDAYDNLGFHIGSASSSEPNKGWGSYTYCEFIYYTVTFDIPTPTNAVVGPAMVYADAFNYYPWDGGVPYCPEKSGTFNIIKP